MSLYLWTARVSSLKGSRELCLIFILRGTAPCHVTWSTSTMVIFYCLLTGVTLEIFWNMLPAWVMGKCLYPSLETTGMKSLYLAKLYKGCCSWGQYWQDVNVDILCFFKFLYSVSGNPCAILNGILFVLFINAETEAQLFTLGCARTPNLWQYVFAEWLSAHPCAYSSGLCLITSCVVQHDGILGSAEGMSLHWTV